MSNNMNQSQEEFLAYCKEEHTKRLDVKFREGDKEHESDIEDMPLIVAIENAIDENLDSWVYLMKALAEAKKVKTWSGDGIK